MSELLIDLREVKFEPTIKGVIHVGAHKAEEYDTYMFLGAEKVIYIEANPQLIPDLIKRFNDVKNVNVIEAAISDKEYDAEFKIHNDTHTSSLLEMDIIAETHPELFVAERIKIRTTTLDKVIAKFNLNLENVNLLTIDVQGVELQALIGCEDNLKHFDYVYIEVETWELYKGAKNYDEIKAYLDARNFEIVTEHIRHWGWGDILFKRK